MKQVFKTFFRDEAGAVTVDWVVITAAVVGMAAVSFWAIEDTSLALLDAAGNAVDRENDGFSK
ncbi:hypothetical protein [Litorisediminicola beolgyonensis]|uniref:Pilus assembly protein n=1 Tax=Litorisediminicola beolgyonensis TaxID=1173614 RepID=A0ABW3ZHS4_9RHOB